MYVFLYVYRLQITLSYRRYIDRNIGKIWGRPDPRSITISRWLLLRLHHVSATCWHLKCRRQRARRRAPHLRRSLTPDAWRAEEGKVDEEENHGFEAFKTQYHENGVRIMSLTWKLPLSMRGGFHLILPFYVISRQRDEMNRVPM